MGEYVRMEKQCWHCNGPLSLTKRLKGDLFCSKHHEELYHQAQSELAVERVKIGVKTDGSRPSPEAPVAPAPVPVVEPEQDTLPPLAGLMRQLQTAPVAPEPLVLFPEEALDLESEPTHPPAGSAVVGEHQIGESGILSVPPNSVPFSGEFSVSDRQDEPIRFQGLAPAIPSLNAEIAIQEDDAPPCAPPLPEWAEELSVPDEPASLPLCEPIYSQPAAPSLLASSEAGVGRPLIAVATPSVSSWPPARSSHHALVEASTHTITAQTLSQVPVLAPALGAPSPPLCGLLYPGFSSGKSDSRPATPVQPASALIRPGEIRFPNHAPQDSHPALREDHAIQWDAARSAKGTGEFGRTAMFAELPRRTSPLYSRNRTPAEIAVRTWAPPALIQALWERADASIGEQMFESAPEAAARSQPVKLPVESATIADAAVRPTTLSREISVASQAGVQESAVLAQNHPVQPTPRLLLGRPLAGTQASLLYPASARKLVSSFTHMASGRDVYVGPMPRLEPLPKPTLRRASDTVVTALPVQPMADLPRLGVEAKGKVTTELQPRIGTHSRPAVGVPHRAIFIPRLLPADRTPGLFVTRPTNGEAASLRAWFSPIRVRPASMLVPLPLSRYRLPSGMDSRADALPVALPQLQEGDGPLRPALTSWQAPPRIGTILPGIADRAGHSTLKAGRRPIDPPISFARIPDNPPMRVPVKSHVVRPTAVVRPVIAPAYAVLRPQRPEPANLFRPRVKASPNVLSLTGPLPRRRGAALPPVPEVPDKLSGQNWALL